MYLLHKGKESVHFSERVTLFKSNYDNNANYNDFITEDNEIETSIFIESSGEIVYSGDYILKVSAHL